MKASIKAGFDEAIAKLRIRIDEQAEAMLKEQAMQDAIRNDPGLPEAIATPTPTPHKETYVEKLKREAATAYDKAKAERRNNNTYHTCTRGN